MSRFQEILDEAFRRPDATREPPQPTELTLARERELAERAKKIEALRQARIAREATQH
jgi:hypothetical protein